MDWFLYDNGLRHERVKKLDKNFKAESVCKKIIEINMLLFGQYGNNMIQRKFSVILIIQISKFNDFLKINNRARRIYSGALFAACAEEEKFIFHAH